MPVGLQALTQRLERLAFGIQGTRNDVDLRREFDAAFYLEQNPHVGHSGIEPFRHYLENGWKEGLDPVPWFSSVAYLAAYDDVREAGVNPFAHYIRHGRREGRSAGVRSARREPQNGARCEAAPPGSDPDAVALIAEAIAPHFDKAFYLSVSPDVAAAAVDPILHYVTVGWSEGRDPAPGFSTRYYLEANPDVREHGLNPFWHYVVAGKEERRLPIEPGGYKAEILKSLPPFSRTVEQWRAHPRGCRSVAREELNATLRAAARACKGRLVVSFTQDNYTEVVGGVQLCAAREQVAALDAGHCYLSLHPAQSLPCLAPPAKAASLGVNVLLNGELLGAAPVDQVAAAICEAHVPRMATSLVIHSLLGHAPEAVIAMAGALQPADAWFWLHDNFSICPSYALQRNGISYCGAPLPNSQACQICVYGEERRRHLPRIRALFDSIDFTIVAPSQAELDLWMARSDLAAGRSIILPHLSLDWSAAREPKGDADATPIRVAFAGIASPIKGWPVYRRLAERCAGPGGYVFHYFGINDPDTSAVAGTRVSVGGERPTAMRDALMSADIDLLVHWSTCPETFSFSAYEALAAGAAIVTHPGSGNVAVLVQESGRGILIENEEALLAFFLEGEARALAEANRRNAKRGAHLALSRMTIDLIEGKRADGDTLLHELHL